MKNILEMDIKKRICGLCFDNGVYFGSFTKETETPLAGVIKQYSSEKKLLEFAISGAKDYFLGYLDKNISKGIEPIKKILFENNADISSPILLIKRENGGRLDIDTLCAVVITSCIDYVFFSHFFTDGGNSIYRNRSRGITALEIPALPPVENICNSWQEWKRSLEILNYSPRMLFAKDDGAFKLWVLDSNIEIMKVLRRAGFIWERGSQTWTGEEGVNVAVIDELIGREKAMSPEELGFLPAWFCEGVHRGEIHTTPCTLQAGGEDLWKILAGKYL